MRTIFRRQEAFTLIELMIVVAIIGILAAIAIPNFLKFQCKSKQSEAKTDLAGIFTAEKAFFGEYNTYSTDLISVNWQPDGSPLYIYGFVTASTASLSSTISGYNDARQDTMNASVIGSPTKYNTVKTRDLANTYFSNASLPPSSASGQVFTAGAAGDVDTDASITASAYDKWTIDSQKSLKVVNNDCTT